MWNRKKEEEFAPRPSIAPTASSPAREGIPMNPIPARSHEADAGRTASVGKSVVLKGQLFSREDLYIDGEVEGSVEMPEHRLTVGPNGKVIAGIRARDIVVLGTIHGNVEAGDKIEIRKDAKLVGDIKTARIVIEDGAYFKGSIDISKPEAKAPQRVAAPLATAAPAVSAASAVAGEIKR
jgi:cytoskeletal protein CcmA (bactofilin family)